MNALILYFLFAVAVAAFCCVYDGKRVLDGMKDKCPGVPEEILKASIFLSALFLAPAILGWYLVYFWRWCRDWVTDLWDWCRGRGGVWVNVDEHGVDFGPEFSTKKEALEWAEKNQTSQL